LLQAHLCMSLKNQCIGFPMLQLPVAWHNLNVTIGLYVRSRK